MEAKRSEPPTSYLVHPENRAFVSGRAAQPAALLQQAAQSRLDLIGAWGFGMVALACFLLFVFLHAIYTLWPFLIGPTVTVEAKVLSIQSQADATQWTGRRLFSVQSGARFAVTAVHTGPVAPSGRNGQPVQHRLMVDERVRDIRRYEKGGPITIRYVRSNPSQAEIPGDSLRLMLCNLADLTKWSPLFFLPALSSYLYLRRDRFLLQAGRPVRGWVSSSNRSTNEDGKDVVTIRYQFLTPAGRTVRGCDSGRRLMAHLEGKPLPAPGTPVTVLVANAVIHQLL